MTNKINLVELQLDKAELVAQGKARQIGIAIDRFIEKRDGTCHGDSYMTYFMVSELTPAEMRDIINEVRGKESNDNAQM